jgi:glycolate oxidase
VSALEALAAALPPGAVVTDPAVLADYRQDRALDPDAATPLAVVLAERTADVQAAVRWAAEHRIPVVPRGAGSGLSGGATAVEGGIVVSTERMRGVAIDPTTRMAVVQPGLLNAELKREAARLGLWYPPDPASFEFCSIGGNVATNAGGLCCVKYGVTTDYVLGLEVVLSDGTAVRLGGDRLKDVAGLSLVKLFVGSEGTLGIITEITLRLLPAAPPSRTVSAWFDSTAEAGAAILEIASAIRPSMLEYMDHLSIDAVEDELALGLDREAAAWVIARSDEQDPEGREVRIMLDAFARHGARVSEAPGEEGERLAHARRIAIPSVEKRGRLLLSDVGVAIPRLADLIAGVEAIAAEHRVEIAFIAHAGDGNTHPLVLVGDGDPDHERRAHVAYGEIMSLAIRLGGTITGEHGVGKLKRPWLADQVGDDVIALTQRIKDALDPLGILNPGTIFEAPPKGTTHAR